MTKPTSLYEARKRQEFTVTSTPKIGLLENLGVRAGTKVSLQNRYAFGGPVLLRIEGMYTVAIGKDIAKQIAVTEVRNQMSEVRNG